MVRKGNAIPPIQWGKNQGALIWAMLREVEKKDYRLVIMGKKDPSENSVGMNKTAAFKAIGKTILPAEYAIDPDSVGKRVKGQYEHAYKKHAKRLRQTGGGLGGNDDDDDDDSLHEYMSCYIPTDGPDGTTTPEAKNLWDSIVTDFPFFPFFHNLYSTRANVNPPIVITGVGPAGRKIVHLQPPPLPPLMGLMATPPRAATPPPPESISGRSSPIPWSPSPVKVTVTVETPVKIKSSSTKENHSLDAQKPIVKKETPLSDAILRARQNIKKLPAKSYVFCRNTMKQAAKRAAAQDELAQRRLMLDEKAQLIEMQRLGIYTKDEFLTQLAQIEARYKPNQPSPSPAKRLRLSDSSSDIEVL
ncbi:hypothetical protein C8R45DRAFT_1217790 [Mycena sanguinolenta]|nr:hypothetical protein C8R45DRAFT_1217790 [Mycena sanguinolenta]